MESPTYELQADLDHANNEIFKLKLEHAKLKLEFVNELNKSITALVKRKPADPYYMIGGQTHPTIPVTFAIEELLGMVDKYEEKPHRAFFGEDGNFIAWYSEQKEADLKQFGVTYMVMRLSDRLVKEYCLPDLPVRLS